MITEGSVTLPIEAKAVPDKKMPVFYNPVMKSNRDISLSVIKAWAQRPLNIALPLAGSGIRGIRMAKELPNNLINSITLNDKNPNAITLIEKAQKANRVELTTSQEDANIFLLKSKGFDYIDIDPFGTPNPFLDAAVQRLSRKSLLAITATDTAPLSGTYPAACRRKYDATPLRCPIMHEIGVRILIRKAQVIAAQYDKALTPILTYATDHYFRIYLATTYGKKACDAILAQHGSLYYDTKTHHHDIEPFDGGTQAGPLFLGRLWDEELISAMDSDNKIITTIKEEMGIPTVGFYHVPNLAKTCGIVYPAPKRLITAIKKAGFLAASTHFREQSIRTDIPYKQLLVLMKKLSEKKNTKK